MKRLVRILLAVLGLLVVLALVGGVGAYWWVFQRPQPQVDGSLVVAGVKDRVEIVRDQWGVPHVFAQNREDALFAQGYVHAQDRLWQMEFQRRVASGRLSEVLGKSTLENDLFLRTIGFRRVAEQEWSALDAETRAWLESYARGVNAFLGAHQDTLPPEFTILGFKPEPWTPIDSMAWAKVQAFAQSGNMERELLRQQIIAKIGEAKWSELEAAYPKDGPFLIEEGFLTAAQERPVESAASTWLKWESETGALRVVERLARETRLLALGMPKDSDIDPTTLVGSNSWVIAGNRTTTGKPLLANDPHIGIQMPAIWYEIHLKGGSLEVAGVSQPGLPGVIIGHNQRIAWGLTNASVDTQDLYIEKPNPANPKQFEYQGKWEDAQSFHEEVKVKGADAVVREVLVTRHGPIVTGVGSAAKSNEQLALRWAGLDPNNFVRTVVKLNEAQHWEQFRAAMKLLSAPSLATIYADVDGNIGIQIPAWIPLRAKGDGSTPSPGWTGDYDWKGYIPYDELPHQYNPPNGYIATANNAIVPSTYKHFLSKEWAAPYRAQRVVDMINSRGKISPDDMREMLADTYTIPAKPLTALILKANAASDVARRAQDTVKNWDFRYDESSPAPLVVELFVRRAMRATFANKLGDGANGYINAQDVSTRVFLRIAESAPDGAWFDDPTTDGKQETLQDVLNRALAETADDLAKQYGNDPSGWAWGKAHIAAFNHPLGAVKPLDMVFNLSTGVGGGSFSVFRTNVGTNMGVGSISSMRQLIDMSDLTRSRIQHTHGQSGMPFNRHFSDTLQDWRTVNLHPMLWDRASINAKREATLLLLPQ